MINNKLLYYKTKDGYTKDASNISSESIVFIEDDGTIRTHNKTFGQPLTADEDNLTVKNNVITVKNRTSDRGRGYVVLKKMMILYHLLQTKIQRMLSNMIMY